MHCLHTISDCGIGDKLNSEVACVLELTKVYQNSITIPYQQRREHRLVYAAVFVCTALPGWAAKSVTLSLTMILQNQKSKLHI